MKRIIFIITLLVVVCGISYWAFFSGDTQASQQFQEYKKAEELLVNSQPKEALNIILKYTRVPEEAKAKADHSLDHTLNWLELEIQAFEQLESVPRLVYLFKQYPEAFDTHEDTILMLARLLIQFRQDEDYNKLREHWKGKETKEIPWLLVDSDYFILQGEFEKASTLLQSKKYEGDDEITRIIRLALIESRNNLKEAWNYLAQAYEINPRSPEVRSFRAQILESVDQLPLARVEYMASFVADPENPKARDQLAEFYRRNKQYHLALQTWFQGLETFSADYIWLKARFWSTLVVPVEYDWADKEIPEGHLSPFVKYLIDLPPGQYWDKKAFRVLPETHFLLTTRQETFWLQLIQALKNGNEIAAQKILDETPFGAVSWDADLENGLRQVLTYRQSRTLPMSTNLKHKKEQSSKRHSLFDQLDELATTSSSIETDIPEDLRELLLSDEAFSAAFLAAGWLEVALDFHHMGVIPDRFPEWLSYGLTQGFRLARGDEEALAFAIKQKRAPLLDLLKGELLIKTDQEEKGIAQLQELRYGEEGIGFRASWILANYYADSGKFAQAREVVTSHPKLRDHLTGKEFIAKLAFLEGDEDKAEKLFQVLEEESFVAKSFLAKRAFDSKDFGRARELTQNMIQKYPDMIQLRANLKAIIEAEKQQQENPT